MHTNKRIQRFLGSSRNVFSATFALKVERSPKTHIGRKFESLNFVKNKNLELEENSIYDIMNGSCVSTIKFLQPQTFERQPEIRRNFFLASLARGYIKG